LRSKKKTLVIRDEIHGDMSFDHVLRQAIDHPYFQRLRYIKQVGLAEYVFPCATHTRFQHSLGAAYLAGQYFDSLLKAWVTSPFDFSGELGKTTFFSERTRNCVEAVAGQPFSREFWRQVVSLGGMLHDVGHGPWSHTFEYLDLMQDFSEVTEALSGPIARYFAGKRERRERLYHEDLSVLYIFRILNDLASSAGVPHAELYFLPVAMLVNHKMTCGVLAEELEQALETSLKERNMPGGLDFHRLLRPMISGPFDVDRMDYIQRDGRNCGVSIGGIEWRRIVSKLVPCLARHPNQRGEPDDIVLISNMKNQHVLDDFIFTLFQMYAQVYMHPTIVGFEESIRSLLGSRPLAKRGPVVTFDLHQSLTDERFRDLLEREFGISEVGEILLRKPGKTFQVASYPENEETDRRLKARGFSLLDTLDRPMMKDRMGVFLFSTFKDGGGYILQSWDQVSPIAHHFHSINYSPRIWISGLA
jgi:HD superfamily phosphohydrolase